MSSKKQSDRKNSTRKQVRIPDALLKQIEESGAINLSEFIIRACEEKLRSGSVR